MADRPVADDPALVTISGSKADFRDRLRSLDLRPTHAAVLLLAIAILVVAVMIGRSLADAGGGASGSQQTSGKVALSDWVVWKRATVPASVKPLMPGARAVKPVGVPGVTIVTADIAADGIPAWLSALQLDRIERRQLAAGDQRANIYTAPLAGRSGATATTVFVPTTAGASVTTCVADVSDSGIAGNDCLAVLTTYIQMHETPIAGDRIDGDQVDKFVELIAAFGAARQRDSAELAKAQTSPAQATIAARLGDGYEAVAKVASGISYSALTSASGEQLAAALADGAAAYAALAKAAESRSPAAFRTARADALATNARIDAAVRQLGALGYAAQ